MSKFISNHGRYLTEKKKNKLLRIVLIVLLVIVIAVAAVFGYIWSKLNLIQRDKDIDKSVYATVSTAPTVTDPPENAYTVDVEGLETMETPPEIVDTEIMSSKDVLNILLIGTDEREEEFNIDARSDTMILASINRKENTIKLTSFERGIGVPILDGEYKGQYDWLTNIFRYGGADLLIRTIEECFKIDIDHYVRVNFRTVTNVVDSIGGIELDIIPREQWFLELYRGVYQSTTTQAPIVVGTNTFDGGMALGYARLRAVDDDWFRIERQRKVIIATANKLKGSSLVDLNNLANQVLPLVQTDLTNLQIADLMLYAPQLLGAEFSQLTIPVPDSYGGLTVMGGGGSFGVNYNINNPILHEFIYGEAAEPTDAE